MPSPVHASKSFKHYDEKLNVFQKIGKNGSMCSDEILPPSLRVLMTKIKKKDIGIECPTDLLQATQKLLSNKQTIYDTLYKQTGRA